MVITEMKTRTMNSSLPKRLVEALDRRAEAEALLRRISIVVEPAREVAVIREDPEDNRVLEAARAGDADVIVSGDRHLLSLERFGATVIRNPRELLNEIESSL